MDHDKRFPVSPSVMPHGSSIPVGWKIVEIDGSLYYVKE